MDITNQNLNFNFADNQEIQHYYFDILYILNGNESERITKILNNVKYYENENKKKYRINIISKNNTEEINNSIKTTKIILNLHDDVQPDINFFYSVISQCKIIISENYPYCNNQRNDLSNVVLFIDKINDSLSNIANLYNHFDFFLLHTNETIYKNYIINSINALKENLQHKKKIKHDTFNTINSTNAKIAVFILDIDKNTNIEYLNNIKNKEKVDWYYITNKTETDDIFYKIIKLDNIEQYGVDLSNISQNNIELKKGIIQSKILLYFSSYDYSVWIDSSIKIINDNIINYIKNIINFNYDIYIYYHYYFKDIIDKYNYSVKLKHYDFSENKIYEQTKKYVNEYVTGLYETKFIILKNVESINKLLVDWYNNMMEFGGESQISFTYVLYKNYITPFILNDKNYIKILDLGSICKNNIFELCYNIIDYDDYANINTKIKYIDKILYINLDRSEDRRNHMEKMLQKINIPYEKITAVDGNNIEKYDYIVRRLAKKLTNYELACSLSHCKSIVSLSSEQGKYFLIIEDDCDLFNTLQYNEDLEQIIKNAPDFDILMIYKTSTTNILKNKYENINIITNTIKDERFGGMGAYILSTNGIKKFCSNNQYLNISKDNPKEKLITNKILDAADIYIFKYLKTYVYKYNFAGLENKLQNKSTIHDIRDLYSKSMLFELYNFKYGYFFDTS